VAGIIGIPGRLQLEWVAAFARNPRPTSSECALTNSIRVRVPHGERTNLPAHGLSTSSCIRRRLARALSRARSNQKDHILFVCEALERRTKLPGRRNGILSVVGIIVSCALVFRFPQLRDRVALPVIRRAAEAHGVVQAIPSHCTRAAQTRLRSQRCSTPSRRTSIYGDELDRKTPTTAMHPEHRNEDAVHLWGHAISFGS
jgi:hypothetical protein